MPIYEYICNECKEQFECLVFGNDKVSCPKCDSTKVKKLISSCNFKSAGGEFSSASSGCSTCSSSNCSSCH